MLAGSVEAQTVEVGSLVGGRVARVHEVLEEARRGSRAEDLAAARAAVAH